MRPRALVALLATGALAVSGFALWNATRDGSDDEHVAGSPGARNNGPGVPSLAAGDAMAAKRGFDCSNPTGDVARVDGEPISMGRWCSVLVRTGATPADADRAQARLALDHLIDAAVVHHAAERAHKVATDAEIDAAMRELGVTSGSAADPGVDPALLRDQLRERLELAALARAETEVSITEADVDGELARGAPGIDRGQGTRVDGWLARIAPNADPAAAAASEVAVRAFADALATQAPEQAAKAHGLTYVSPFVVGSSGLEPALESAARALDKGRTSGPLRTRVGWTVIRALGTSEGTPLTDKALRARVRSALETRTLAGATTQTLARLRAAASIEILVEL